ncbi:APC family permease [Rubrobacter tropicus]|uniref:APC family permease n=1 Tax=Rubrobacter tropicus TaxID=2653851 RepID=UPI00140C2F7B|nr:APC family permease [Rubrobacter tropicus]
MEGTLTVTSAVALALGVVIGAGLLALPGLAYREAGPAAVYAWVIDGLIVVPLLVIFGYLGSRHPQAGGIAGFVREGFGPRAGAATETLLLGTFSLGIPAIAIVGGDYLSYLTGGGDAMASAAAAVLVLLAGTTNAAGARLSGSVQQIVSYLLVAVLCGVAVAGLTAGFSGAGSAAGSGIAPLSAWAGAVPALGLVFFAFTGWEMLSFTTEEYKNPRRDYPIAVAVSFVVVIGLYVALALAVQLLLSPDDPRISSAPIAAVLEESVGIWSGGTMAGVGVAIVVANVNGATWAASRLAFSSAREGLLPGGLARVTTGSRLPRNAVVVTTAAFLVVVAAHAAGAFSQQAMLSLAGQNFFLLYLFSVGAYLRLVRSWPARAFGLCALLPCLLVAGSFGWGLLYPAVLVVMGATAQSLRRRAHQAATGQKETAPEKGGARKDV